MLDFAATAVRVALHDEVDEGGRGRIGVEQRAGDGRAVGEAHREVVEVAGRQQVVRDDDPRTDAVGPRFARPATAAPRRGSAAARKPTVTSRAESLGEHRADRAAVVVGALVARAGDGEHDGVGVLESGGSRRATSTSTRRGSGPSAGAIVTALRPADCFRRSTRTWYPADSSSGTITTGVRLGNRGEGCRDIRLLHVDVPEPHRDVGQPRGDRVDEAADRGLALARGGAVRDREERGCRHPPIFSPRCRIAATTTLVAIATVVRLRRDAPGTAARRLVPSRRLRSGTAWNRRGRTSASQPA